MKLKISLHETTGRDVKRETWHLNEQGFYRVVNRSDHPRAINFSNKVAQFLKDVRQGNIGQEELDKMQGDVQMFFSFFTTILPQRKVNHKRNRTPKLEDGNARFWNRGHELIGKMSCQERKAELIKRGAPSPLVNRSGLDGLRWFEDTYWESIPHSLRAQLALRKYPHQQMIPEAVSKPYRIASWALSISRWITTPEQDAVLQYGTAFRQIGFAIKIAQSQAARHSGRSQGQGVG